MSLLGLLFVPDPYRMHSPVKNKNSSCLLLLLLLLLLICE